MGSPPSDRRLSRRRFVTLSAAAVATAALAACGRSPATPTAPPATLVPSPTPRPPSSIPTFAPAPTLAPTAPTVPPTAAATRAPTVAPTATATRLAPTATVAPSPTPVGKVFNVKQYGAKGDGATDDTDAIQKAINAVPVGGGTVFFPSGTYIVAPTKTRGLDVKSNLRVAGAGEESVLKIRDHNGDWQRLFASKDLGEFVENVAFEDLAFDSNIVNNPESKIDERNEETYQTFIFLTAGRDLHVRRCHFLPYSGVWAVSLNGQTISDCSVTDSTFRFLMRDGNPDYDNSAIYIEGTRYTMSGNRFESAPILYRDARAAMEAHGGPAAIFDNTSVGFQTILNIVGSYFPGGNSSDIVCRDNIAQDALIGIMLWPTAPNGLRNVTVTNNTVEVAQLKHGTADMGGVCVIFSPEATAPAANITITKNTVRFQDEGAGRPGDFYYNSGGIYLHNLGGVSDCVIEGNTIENAPTAGVVIGLPEPGQRTFKKVRVLNNTILNPGQNIGFPRDFRAGILVNSSATDIEIAGNTITETLQPARCPAAISFDLSPGITYSRIRVTDNTTRTIGGLLPMTLPYGTER